MILAVAVLAAVCGSVHAQTADAAPELEADDLYAWLYAVGKGGTVLKRFEHMCKCIDAYFYAYT